VPTTGVVPIDITQVGTQINAAYFTAATSVFAAETPLYNAGATSTVGVTSTPTTAASVASQASQAITTLQNSITSGLTQQPNLSGLIQAQLTGTGGLATEMGNLFSAAAAGTTDGSVPQSSLGLLYTAVDGALNAALQEVASDGYLYSLGQTTTGFDTGQFGTTVDAAFSTLATQVRAAEMTLYVPTESPVSGTSGTTGTTTPVTGATVATQAQTAITTLQTSLTSAFGSISGAFSSAPGLIQSQLTDSGGLSTEMTNLFTAASAGTSDGSVPQSELSLLYTAVSGALNASYQETASDGYLISSGQQTLYDAANASSSSTGSGSSTTTGTGTTTGSGTTGTTGAGSTTGSTGTGSNSGTNASGSSTGSSGTGSNSGTTTLVGTDSTKIGMD
jgi:hypothetical protein